MLYLVSFKKLSYQQFFISSKFVDYKFIPSCSTAGLYHEIDIWKSVQSVRTQRPGIIQTEVRDHNRA